MVPPSVSGWFRKHPVAIEVSFFLACLCLYVFTMREMLIRGSITMMHDNLFGELPIYHFFAESLLNGRLPLWNPFSTGGAPFYPLLAQLRLLDPLSVLSVFIGQFFTRDTICLAAWNRFGQSVVMLVGAYLVLRPFARHLTSRLALIPVVTLSYLMYGSLRQPGIFHLFAWIPFIVLFLLRIIYYRDYRTHNWLALALLIGLNWQSYNFVPTDLILLFFFCGFLFFRRDLLLSLWRSHGLLLNSILFLAVVLAMMAPNLSLWLERDSFVYPYRMWHGSDSGVRPEGDAAFSEGGRDDLVSPIKMSYQMIAKTGSIEDVGTLLETISPDDSFFLEGRPARNWRAFRDGAGYLGPLVFLLALVGVFFGVQDLKWVWLGVCGGLALFMLGPDGGLQRALFAVFPPVRFLRHTQFVILSFYFCCLYFFVLGMDFLLAVRGRSPFGNVFRTNFLGRVVGVVLSTLVLALVLSAAIRLPESARLLIPVLLYSSLAFGWLSRKFIGTSGLFAAVALACLGVEATRVPNPAALVLHFTAIIGFSAVLWALRRRISWGWALSGLFLLCLTLDFWYGLNRHLELYLLHPHLGRISGLDTTARPPVPPSPRRLYPVQPKNPYLELQAIRNIEVYYREPFAFSSPRHGSPDTFSQVLGARRWNTLLLTKNYFNLVHSGVPPEVMSEIFAVGEESFQFRSSAVSVDDSRMAGFFQKMDTEKAGQWVRDFVAVQGADMSFPPVVTPIENRFSIKFQDYQYADIQAILSSRKPGYVYWADGYDRWWRAFIDGKRIPLYRAGIAFKAFPIPAGEHELRLIYRPVPFLISLAIYYGVFLCVLCALFAPGLSALWPETTSSGRSLPLEDF